TRALSSHPTRRSSDLLAAEQARLSSLRPVPPPSNEILGPHLWEKGEPNVLSCGHAVQRALPERCLLTNPDRGARTKNCGKRQTRSEEHTSELQSRDKL